ncbi:hypothetical protein Tco_1376138 [Tanacetum coccineum]
MENANPFMPALSNGLHARITHKLNELHAISAMIDSRLENIDHICIIIPPTTPFEQLLNDFMNPHDVFEIDDLESYDESVDTPLVSPFLDSDDELGDGEVLNEIDEYGNAGIFYRNRIINSIDRDDLAFPCMIGFRKFVSHFDTFLPMNIITRKAYNTMMVEGFKSTERNLDIGKFIVSDISEFVMGRAFRAVTQLEYDYVKGLISFTRIFDTYIFLMPRTIRWLKNFS